MLQEDQILNTKIGWCPKCSTLVLSDEEFCKKCGYKIRREDARIGLQSIGRLAKNQMWLGIGLGLLWLWVIIIRFNVYGIGNALGFAILGAILVVPPIVGGVGLLNLRPWARKTLIAVSVGELFVMPGLGTILGAWSLYVLTRPRTKVILKWLSEAEVSDLTRRGKTLLPKKIFCPKCNAGLSLTAEQRSSAVFSCAVCNEEFVIED